MFAIPRLVDHLDQLLAADFARLGMDRYLALSEIHLNFSDAFDLPERLLDRVAAFLSDQAMHFEDKGLGAGGGQRWFDHQHEPGQD